MTEDNVALVTGSSSGIGAAVAKRLALDGFAVAINFSNNPDPAEAVRDNITNDGLLPDGVDGQIDVLPALRREIQEPA